MDKYQKFGAAMLAPVLFVTFMLQHGIERVVYVSGFVYCALFIFHAPLTRLLSGLMKKPLQWYGIFVVLNGLLVEVLAYISNLDRIRAGQKAYLFATGGLAEDLLVSLPYYAVLACVYGWAVRRWVFSVFELGLVIWLFWAINVDEWAHIRAFFGASLLEATLGFIFAGMTMLFTLHAPIVLFEKALAEKYPERQTGRKKYLALFMLQFLSLVPPLLVVVTRLNPWHLW